MYVSQLGYLIHLYYGPRVATTELTHLVQLLDRGFGSNPYELGYVDRAFSLDNILQEYSTFGEGDYRVSCLEVINSDGTSAVDLRYVSHSITLGKPLLPGLPQIKINNANSLSIKLQDKNTKIYVTLQYTVIESLDSITRSAEIQNLSPNTTYLTRALSAQLEFPTSDYDIISLDGNSQSERQVTRTSVRHGKIIIDSLRGTTSHEHNNFVALVSPTTDEDHGDAYGVTLLYSGNFAFEVEVDPVFQLRMTVGINPRRFKWKLIPNGRFQTPEVVFTFSDEGIGGLSRRLHQLFMNNLIRSEWKQKRRPILINNWEATYFAFNDDKLLKIAKDAHPLGIEMLVMDDGWFGHRNNDQTSLGDWFVNPDKIRRGLPQLVHDINQLGMSFGIWFEPEMISEDSQLYKEHPDWAFVIPGRKPILSRAQLVLDMTRQDVRDYLFTTISTILQSANITYIKWDMNRHLTDLYSVQLPADQQGEIYHRYVLGVYDLLERIVQSFPHLLLEGCSGGGGRFDAGMLYYAPQSWLSDDTDAIERLKIQFGSSLAYPVSSFGSHVSAVPNHQTGRTVPMFTRGIVAMTGTFGYELDLSNLSADDLQTIRDLNTNFHKFYDTIQYGDFYRLVSPFENQFYCAWMFVSHDKNQALVNIVQMLSRTLPPLVIIKLKGLDPLRMYNISRYPGKIFSGTALMNAGICLPFEYGDGLAWQYEVHAV